MRWTTSSKGTIRSGPRTIERAITKALGDDPGFEELTVTLVASMLAVADARDRIAADLEVIGAQLLNSMYVLKNALTAKAGDTTAINRKAATLRLPDFRPRPSG